MPVSRVAFLMLAIFSASHVARERYVIIEGPGYEQVGRATFASYVRLGECRKLDAAMYPKLRLTVHRCYV